MDMYVRNLCNCLTFDFEKSKVRIVRQKKRCRLDDHCRLGRTNET